MAVNTAPVKWAQRADSIYLTLDLPDVKDEQLKLTKDMLSFRQVLQLFFLEIKNQKVVVAAVVCFCCPCFSALGAGGLSSPQGITEL